MQQIPARKRENVSSIARKLGIPILSMVRVSFQSENFWALKELKHKSIAYESGREYKQAISKFDHC